MYQNHAEVVVGFRHGLIQRCLLSPGLWLDFSAVLSLLMVSPASS